MSASAIELAKAGGFEVSKDADQPGLWVWTRKDAEDKQVEGCDCSFRTEEEAWLDAARTASGAAMAERNISDAEWDSKSHDQQASEIRETFGFPAAVSLKP